MSSNSGQPQGLSPDALSLLVEARQQFLQFIQKRVDSRAAAEDILQAAFVRGIEKGGAVRNEESVLAWFYRILRNAIIDYYRKQASVDRATTELMRHLEDHEDPDELSRGDICQCITALLQAVKPEYREALQTVDLEDGSLTELAGKAGITANNAAVRVHRAREALRKQVTLACGVCATHGCLDCHCQARSGLTAS
jgi:RNA polymerase sigma-70 factor, ECF subfamily